MERNSKFSKGDRLLSRSDFDAVFDAAHTSTQERAIFHREPYILYRKSSDKPRLGLSIARRVIRKATERNRIKRCIREFFRIHKDELRGDYIIRVVNRPTSDDFETLTAPLKSVLLKKVEKRTK